MMSLSFSLEHRLISNVKALKHSANEFRHARYTFISLISLRNSIMYYAFFPSIRLISSQAQTDFKGT